MDTDTAPVSDQPTEAPEQQNPAPAATAEPAVAPDAEKLASQLEHWKSMARKNEQRAKENAAAAARLTEIEDAQKSEAEKLQAKLEAAERRAAEAEQARLRAEVAQTKGVPADLLSGSTEDELQASADALLAFRGQPPAPEYGRSTDAPPKKPRQLTKADMSSMSADEITKADEAGLFDDLKAGRTR